MLDIVEDERTAWIDSRTEGEPAVRAGLVAMREADRRTTLRTAGIDDAMDEEAPPQRIGAYRIIERIGRGGMGAVYRGERATGDFTHQVAIKVIKAGLLSDVLVDRFRSERQTLAGLVHPHIAQLHDGGETEAGSPYIVMELVDGLPLLQWAEDQQLSRAARQHLFGDICGAVAFAHRSLIVHRDLTPSNVLVTRDGVVKLFAHNDRLARIVGTVEARVQLADRAQTYLSELAASPRTDDVLKSEAAQGFIKLGRIRGVPIETNLGQKEKARGNLQQAIRLLDAIDDPAIETAPDLATARALLAMIELHIDADAEQSGRTVARAASVLAAVPENARSNRWLVARGDVRTAQIERAILDGRNRDVIRLADVKERETAHWPAPLRSSHTAALEHASAASYRANGFAHLDDASVAEKAAVIPAYRKADRQFRALDQTRPNDPPTLYLWTWNNYMAAGGVTNAGDARAGKQFLEAGLSSVKRLLALEEHDEPLRYLEINIRETLSQVLAQGGQFAQAVALQRKIVSDFERKLPKRRPLSNLNRLAFSSTILGEIGREAGNRKLACDSWRQAMNLYGEIESRGEIDYHRRLLPYLRENLKRCDRGVQVGGFLEM